MHYENQMIWTNNYSSTNKNIITNLQQNASSVDKNAAVLSGENHKYYMSKSLANEFSEIVIFEYFGYLKIFDADTESPHMT